MREEKRGEKRKQREEGKRKRKKRERDSGRDVVIRERSRLCFAF